MKRITALAAAAIATAVWAIPAHADQPTNTSTNINDTNTSNSPGGTVNVNTDNSSNTKLETGKDMGTWNVRHELAMVAEEALTKGDLKKLSSRFVDADRDRIQKSANFQKDDPQLDAKIDLINSEWKSKFGHEFKVSSTSDVFADAQVKFGEIGRDPQLASEIKKNSEAANPADSNKTFGGSDKLDSGRNVASVSLPALADAPALTVPLIHELPASWKINVPDSMDATRLRANLGKHLDMVADSSKWPSDEKQAMALVTRHVLMAVLDTDSASAGATGTSSDLNAIPAASRDNALNGSSVNSPANVPANNPNAPADNTSIPANR